MELSKENQEWLERNKYDDGLGGYDMSPDDVKAKLLQDQQKIEELEKEKLILQSMVDALNGKIDSLKEDNKQ